MKQAPRLLDMAQMREIFAPHYSEIRERIFLSEELGMIHSEPTALRLMMTQKPPFCISDHRLGVITQGEATVNLNLQDRHLTAGTLVYLGPGTIITPIRFSDDLQINGIALFTAFPMPFAVGQMPAAFNGQVRDFQITAEEPDILTTLRIFEALWHLVHRQDYYRPTATSLVAAQMHHYDQLYRRSIDQLSASRSREQTIFDRFIQLVNLHCGEQHQLGYYADRMCLTPRYLSTVIRQASGTTAKDWIDRALITRIKVDLRHTDKSVAQISDDLHFPNPSFFSKYFHRLEGMTPLEFRQA
jgi:AraC-like DNA-binding protein